MLDPGGSRAGAMYNIGSSMSRINQAPSSLCGRFWVRAWCGGIWRCALQLALSFCLADRSSRLLVVSWAFFRCLIATSLACTFVVVLGYRLWVATTTRLSRCQRFRVGGSESITKVRTISQCVVLKIKWKENRNTLPVNYLAPSLPYTPDTEQYPWVEMLFSSMIISPISQVCTTAAWKFYEIIANNNE